jgi:hypothetical protein
MQFTNKYNKASITRTRQLHFAQCKLQSNHIPLQLRAIAYVRICSSAMQHYQSVWRLKPRAKTPYLNLLKSLSEQERYWWNTCWVSRDGLLESTNPAIHQLLNPLNTFIQEQLELVAA